MVSNNNAAILYQLKLEFEAKIKADWDKKWKEKYSIETFAFNELKSQTAFLDDLQFDIEQSLKAKIGLGKTAQILVSRDSLRRIFVTNEPKLWKDKTKNTLAIYLGYDDWDNFEEAFKDLAPYESTFEEVPLESESEEELIDVTHPTLPAKKTHPFGLLTFSKRVMFFAFLAMILLGFALYFLMNRQYNENDSNFTATQKTLIYPTVFDINYHIKGFNSKTKAFFKIENEFLAYTEIPNMIPLKTANGSFKCQFTTPGLKKFSLDIDDKTYQSGYYLVSTGGNWYGSARIKTRQFASHFVEEGLRTWYGTMDRKENTITNWLTIPTNWTNYLDLHSGKVHYPGGVLSFPKDQLLLNNNNNQDNYNRRVAYIKAENFPLTLDSLELSFKAKRDLILNEDCMSFMFQLFDSSYNKFEVYSAHNCDVYNISCSLLMPNGKYDYQDDIEEKKIDEVLEDGEWHNFDLHIKSNSVKIEVDSKPIITFKKRVNFKQIREIWFVFEGNGYIDDVVMKNSTTGKVIMNDTFNQ